MMQRAHEFRMAEVAFKKWRESAPLHYRLMLARNACAQAAAEIAGVDLRGHCGFETLNWTWWASPVNAVDYNNNDVPRYWRAQSIHYDMAPFDGERWEALHGKLKRLGFRADLRWPQGQGVGVIYIYDTPGKPKTCGFGERLGRILKREKERGWI